MLHFVQQYLHLHILPLDAPDHEVSVEKMLSIWDLHHLLFLLANVATKWRAIGGGLHFPELTLDVIGQKLVCIVGGPVQCLRELLAQWLGHDKPTTSVLAVVLRHPDVNEGQLADTLERTFQPARMYTVYHCVTCVCHVPCICHEVYNVFLSY